MMSAVAGLGVVLAVLLVVLFVAAAVSVLRSQQLTGIGKLVWIIGILVFPVLGSLAWFLIGRGSTPQLYRTA